MEKHYLNTTGTTDFGAAAIFHVTSGNGPGTLTQSINQAVSCTYSFNGGISVDGVSAGIGYSLTGTTQITDTNSITLNAGQHGEIDSHLLYNRTYFDVMYCPVIGSDYTTGYGHSDKPSGVAFVSYTNP